jgi:hypothetical protein
MLDYINNYFAVFALGFECDRVLSGLLHSSYLIQMLVAKLAGQTIESMRHHALEPRASSSTSAALDRSPSSDFPSL